MPVLTLPWLGALAAIGATAVAFVLLTRRSAGGPVPWSIAAGLARGVGAWSRGRAETASRRPISPQAEDPGPPLDTSRLPLTPLAAHRSMGGARGEGGADPEFLVGVEIEELGDHRI